MFENLAPQKYTVVLSDIPKGAYLKPIQFNHQPVREREIDLSSGVSGKLEIVIAKNGATVDGNIQDADGNPTKALVRIWSDERSDSGQTDTKGVIKFTGLAPGEYRIAAWADVENEYLMFPDFCTLFDSQKITLTEGSREIVQVKLIPKSASDSSLQPARLRPETEMPLACNAART